MALKPIYGYSGNFPVLDFIGNPSVDPVIPVCMESPNPHPMWTYRELGPSDDPPFYPYNGSVSVSPGEVTASKTRDNEDGQHGFWIMVQLYLVYTGLNTINLSLTSSRSDNFSQVQGYMQVEGVQVPPIFDLGIGVQDWPQSCERTVPYYRYALRFAIGAGNSDIGDWVKLSVSFS